MRRTTFIRWYNNEFHQTELFQKMNNLAENSPWHREDSIGIHTDMVVGEYISMIDSSWDHMDLLGALACAFHDVGKPEASVINGIKWKPERGDYLSFGSHELLSARMWEDYVATNWIKFVELFQLAPRDIHIVAWIIEHHLPWAVKKIDKRKALAQTVWQLGITEVYTNMLTADTWGRISDDGPEKKAKVADWIENFLYLVDECKDENLFDSKPKLIMPIAPSGAGKTTYRDTLPSTTEIFSMDDIRIELYVGFPDETTDADEDYNKAYEMSCSDPGFNQAVTKRFTELLATGNDIFCDNTNTSAKRRRHYITQARRKGYHVQAILFPIDLGTLNARQDTRTDKTVPPHAVRRQYMGLQMPSFHDFDFIDSVSNNL